MIRSLPSPGSRAGMRSSSRRVTQSSHSGHHDPCRAAAPASHSSGLAGRLSLAQWPYLLPGALITPAIWPEADNTNLTGPEYKRVAAYVDFQGAMWSSRVARMKLGVVIFD